MRVISGVARGRKLKEPSGYSIRPTSDVVKESVFNIIQFDIEGRKVLDLFAGTGQMGIETLSRGAGKAVFVDSKADAVRLIWENLKLCGFTASAAVHTSDALRFLENDEKFDLIFVDPPYDTPLAGRTVMKIIEFDKLNANGIIICETKASSAPTYDLPPGFTQKEYRYGSVKISKITKVEERL